jgi:uncharacterized protein (TIRG00374 family)
MVSTRSKPLILVEDSHAVIVEQLPEAPKPLRFRFLRRLLSLLLGLIIVGFLISFIGLDQILSELRPNPVLLIAASVVINVMLAVFAARWAILVNGLTSERKASIFDCYFYSVSSLASGLLFAQSATVIVVRSAALNRLNHVSLKVSISSVIIDKIFDLSYIFFFIIPVLLFFLKAVSLAQACLIALLIFCGAAVLITSKYAVWMRLIKAVINLALSVTARTPFLKRFKRLPQDENSQPVDDWQILKRGAVLRAFWLTALGELMLVARSYLIARAIGLDISPLALFMGITLTQLSLIFAFTPGGLGIVEIGWYVALSEAHTIPSEIGAFLLAHRVFQSAAIVAIWLSLYVWRWIRA